MDRSFLLALDFNKGLSSFSGLPTLREAKIMLTGKGQKRCEITEFLNSRRQRLPRVRKVGKGRRNHCFWVVTPDKIKSK